MGAGVGAGVGGWVGWLGGVAGWAGGKWPVIIRPTLSCGVTGRRISLYD